MNEQLFNMIKQNEIIKLISFINNEKSIDLNIKDNANNYFINYVILLNNKTLLTTVIENGARLDVTDEHGRSILYIPIKFGYIDIINTIVEYDKTIVGINVIDIQDKFGNNALHYSIIYKNIIAMQLMIKNIQNINIQNNKGLSCLHYAVLMNMTDIVESLINNNADIDCTIIGSGETPLHLAIIMGHDNIVDILLKNKCNVNIVEKEYNFTALHYSVLKNKSVLKYLINNNADVNIQDIYGNTVSHYAIDHNYVEFFDIVNMNKINFNLLNDTHQQVLHKLISDDKIDVFVKHFDAILLKSNLNIQDSNGNTVLHLLLRNKIWKTKLDLLKNKKINIFIKNRENKFSIDYIDDADKELIINIICLNYIELVKSVQSQHLKKWEIQCKKYIDHSDDFDVDDFKELKIIIKPNSTCFDIIKLYITNGLFKDDYYLTHFGKSYPNNYKYDIILPSLSKNTQYCTFSGSTFDILCGLIYILNNNKNVLSPIDKNFKYNKNLIKLYKSFGFIINEDTEFLNFEIVWTNKILVFPENFENNMQKIFKHAQNNNIQFIIILLGIEISQNYHTNIVIIDMFSETIERFEPNGGYFPNKFDYDAELLDDLLISKFNTIYLLDYVKPSKYLPRIGFQQFDNINKNTTIGDPDGFCVVWSLYYANMRVINPSLSRKQITNIILRLIKSYPIDESFKSIIRNYSVNITNLRDEILQRADMNINDWNNKKYNADKLQEIHDEIHKLLFK